MPDIPRTVVDTNIFISALLFRGKPGLVLDSVYYGRAVLVYSTALQQETQRVLSWKFGWTADKIRAGCDVYWRNGVLVSPRQTIRECRDPDDNRVLECAVEGQAHFIVSGDKDPLGMVHFGQCAIVTASDFLARIASQAI